MATVATPFNAVEHVRLLREADVPEKQAEAEAEILWKVLEERDKALAEQAQALAALQAQVKSQKENHEKTAGEMATKGDLRDLKTELNAKIEIGNKDLLIRLGSIIGAAVVAILAAMRWMPHAA